MVCMYEKCGFSNWMLYYSYTGKQKPVDVQAAMLLAALGPETINIYT